MPEIAKFIFVAIHILAAIAWIGGAVFIAIVMVPVARGVQPPGVGMIVLRAAAIRFRGVAWGLLATLVVSGLIVLENRGIGFSRFDERDFWDSDIGRVLAIKAVLVGVLLILSAVHDFVLGPRVANLLQSTGPGSPPSPEAAALRRKMVNLARLNLLLALTIVVLGMMLIRGVPR